MSVPPLSPPAPRPIESEELQQWYRQYSEAIHRRCMRFMRNETQAMDLTQETFLRAWRYRASFRREATPLSWLLTIADRLCLDAIRRQKPSVDIEEIGDILTYESSGDAHAFTQHETVKKLLSQVDENIQQVIVHRYFDEMAHEDIAQRMGLSERTVRRYVERFIKKAQQILQVNGPASEATAQKNNSGAKNTAPRNTTNQAVSAATASHSLRSSSGVK